MNIILKRYRHTPKTIDGKLYIYGQKICDTAENALNCIPTGNYPISIIRCKHYHRKMPVVLIDQPVDKSLVNEFFDPIGMAVDKQLIESEHLLGYFTEFAETEQQRVDHCKNCPTMECVTNNSKLPCFCPQIKIGNGVYNRTDGSIIIGEYLAPGIVKKPTEYFNRLIDRLDKAYNRTEPIILTVIEEY